VHRYRFPKGAQAHVLVDLSWVLQAAYESADEHPGRSTGGELEWVSDREVCGRGDYKGGWGHSFPYSVYFFARFDKPAKDRWVADAFAVKPGAMAADGPGCRAVGSFGEVSELVLKVGISYSSLAQARASLDTEAGDASFEDLKARSEAVWGSSLSRIKVEGGTQAQKTLFYSLFARLLCMPTDLGVDDEFHLWRSGVRHFTDFFCLWDSVRNANSLLSLFDPEQEAAYLNCLLDIGKHTGWIPDAWISGHSAMIQGGSSADILFCEAHLKGIPGIDYAGALEFMRKNGEVAPPDPWFAGRHLKDYNELGYLSTQVKKNSVSRHLEYAYQDWCIGTLAQRLGAKDTAAKFKEGSKKLWNLWREDIGFFAPKDADGSWTKPFDPSVCLPDSWNDPYFYEGTSWQWSFSAHHDFAGLIQRKGGPEGFVRHLDEFFAKGYYLSKETMLHVPYLYTYAGRPDLSSARARAELDRHFKVSRDGLSDNEDMGCQSAFAMAVSLGLYPIMGQDLWLLSAPVFERSEIQLGKSGKTLVIEAPGAAPGKVYVASASLNGKPLDRAWLKHAEIGAGAVLKLELSDKAGDWGKNLPPPSPSS
jgi:predicted alpha-1,2-mannosidase